MLILKGKHNSAKVFTNNIEEEAISQIIELCNQEFVKNSVIRIMPDVHFGAGCTIGTTLTIKDKIVANLVGVDIGCGMLTVKLGQIDLDLEAIDNYIKDNIPCGFTINEHPQTDFKDQINNLVCIREIKKSTNEFNRALGSLGSGNHFIEVNIDKNNDKYLVIHSGSRNLGHQVATYYQKRAFDYHNGLNDDYENQKQKLIKSYKEQNKKDQIEKAIKYLKQSMKKECKIPKDLCYLEGQLMEDYLHDMGILQKYANINRKIIADKIINEFLQLNISIKPSENCFQTIHNYIDLENMILRKGAISAKEGEKVLIPINMRDGSIIAIGKGNPDWNYSSPHGAGRLMSRSKAKENYTLEEFRRSMEGIFTTSVCQSTVDEAPMVYKPIEEILENIQETVDIVDIIKPIYNFKSK